MMHRVPSENLNSQAIHGAPDQIRFWNTQYRYRSENIYGLNEKKKHA